ncbi:MAG: AAA family ATPase [Candidatus Aenigmarchaeota archaeon]|nr:AAA family ATPase [Candidatus Aenigmarchaeota archaeon]
MIKETVFVGLVGRIGCGKDAVAIYLKEKYGFVVIRFSDIIREELEREGKDKNRENLQAMGEEMRKRFGGDVLAKRALERAKERAVFNGIRSIEEAEALKAKGAKIIYIDCNAKTRFERVSKRDGIDFKTFEAIDNAPSEKLIDSIDPDFGIDNNYTEEQTKADVDSLMEALEVKPIA